MPVSYFRSGEKAGLRNPGRRLRKSAFSQFTSMLAGKWNMLHLDAIIEPGKAAAGLSIGEPVAGLPEAAVATRSTLGDEIELFDFGPVRVWVKDGLIDQIGVRRGYSGYVGRTTIGVGSSIQQLRDVLGPVVEDEEDNLVVAQVPGVCFETEAWRGDPGCETVEENLDAKLTEIFVFSVRAS
jgi:CRISPR/Cas system-associated endoribonuclease Cas2